jgi:hypothetical protein
MEPGKAWLRQPVAKIIGRLQPKRTYRSRDQGSRWDHQCSDPGSIVRVGASPGYEPLPPLVGSEQLTNRISENVYWSEAAGPPQHSRGSLNCTGRSRIFGFSISY